MDALRTIMTSAAATGGAYASTPDAQASKYMREIIAGTPLDPTTVDYAATGLDPMWAFITVATVGMGPKLADAFREWVTSKNNRAERTLEAQIGGLIEKAPKDAL